MKKLLIICLSLCAVSLMTAQKSVSGTVTDGSGEPLLGVNILEKGTTNGTITDFDGSYMLDVTDENSVLVFSFTGMASQEVIVGSQSNISIELQEDSELLDEVVVSALGYKTKKDEMGSTASTVSSAEVLRSGEALVLNSLAGKASNVEILSTNGDPGAGTNIRIRGANTIEGSSNPLIILDGVPISNSTIYTGGAGLTGARSGGVSQQSRLNDINPNDIESIQVLKGASAASLWGSRAANGVLVITTKNGKTGKPKITFNSTYSIDKITERIPMQSLYGQGRNGVGDTRSSITDAWGDRIADRSGGPDDVVTDGAYFEAEDGTIHYPLAGRTRNSKSTFVDENFDAVFGTGRFLQNDLSISGGTEKATFFFSLGRIDQEGIARSSEYKKTNVRLNNKMFFNDWLNMSTKAGYISSSSNRIQQNSNTSGLMLGLLRTPPDFDISDHIGTYYNADGVPKRNAHRSYRNPLGASINPGYTNPIWATDEQQNTSDVNRFLMSSELNIVPSSWLQFILRGGVDVYNDRRITFFPIGSADSDTRNGAYGEDLVQEKELNFDAIARGNFELSSDISLNATLGWNINDRTRDINTALLQGFLVNSSKITTDLNTSSDASNISKTRRLIRSNRAYAVLSFDMFDQLFVNFSGAQEAVSSVTGTFFYPAVDAAWQFTKYLGDNSPLSFGKLRASWGQVGIQPFAHRTQTLPEGGFGYSTYSDGLSINQFGGGFRIDNVGNDPTLKPELKTEWEIGTDLRFLDDKLSLAMTYYQNEIKDILFNVGTSPTSGFEELYTNAGTMENKGFEAELDYNLFEKKDWNVNLFGNFSRNKNLVTDLQGVTSVDIGAGQSVSSRAVVGEQLGALWSTSAQKNPDGSYVLNDNGFPIITPSEGVIGDPNPDWRAGFGFRANYKKFSISTLFDRQQGGDFSFRTLFVLGRFGTTAETAVETLLEQDIVNYDGDVIPAGTLVRGNIFDFGGGPVLRDESWYRNGPGGGFGDGKIYEFGIYDATNTRLRELSLSYVLDTPKFREKTKLGSITFTATGRNMFVWDNLPGIDPQVNQFGVGNSRGVDYFTNPSTKSYLFSIKIAY